MMWHNGKQFTTLDRDKDMYTGKNKQTNWLYNHHILSIKQSQPTTVYYMLLKSQKGYFGHSQRKYNKTLSLGFLRQPQCSLKRARSKRTKTKPSYILLEMKLCLTLAGHVPYARNCTCWRFSKELNFNPQELPSKRRQNNIKKLFYLYYFACKYFV